ncbi:hypothetical protein [Trueperella pyogenes]|uniref:hypothetical protein n=1 Tax=Trueperella pyogenes TaxID=1661 RepID=UPI003DA9F550
MKKIALAAVACVLAGCSSVVVPAAPTTPPTADPSPAVSESAPEATRPSARNPYEGGAKRDWAVSLPGEPKAVAFDRQSGTVVAAIEDGRGTRLHAFSVSNSGRTLPIWTYDVPGSEALAKIDAASGKVYVSAGQAAAPRDLIALDARSGAEQLRWSRAHVLDAEVPLLVGAYDSGVGIAKLGRDSVSAAIMDSTGRVIADERLFMLNSTTDAIDAGADIINTGLQGKSPRTGSAPNTSFITYPALNVLSAERCWNLTDGSVCVSDGKVLVYDPRGNLLRQNPLPEASAAAAYEVRGMNADTSAAELDSALREKVAQSAQGSTEPTSRVPAILTNGAWLTALPAGAEPLRRGAPFGVVNGNVVNLATSEALAERVIAGAGRSADMFFEWDGSALHYLRPQG